MNLEEANIQVRVALTDVKKDFNLDVSGELEWRHCCPARAAISESVPLLVWGNRGGMALQNKQASNS